MKIITMIGSLFLSSQLFAGDPDLIFENGFENDPLVAGTAAGISSTGLILQLTSSAITENLSVDVNGGFKFASNLGIGAIWSVTITAQPTNPKPLTCSLSNNSGTMPANGVNNLQVTCEVAALIWGQSNWDNADWN